MVMEGNRPSSAIWTTRRADTPRRFPTPAGESNCLVSKITTSVLLHRAEPFRLRCLQRSEVLNRFQKGSIDPAPQRAIDQRGSRLSAMYFPVFRSNAQ